jgi:hypothetical protein
MSQDAYPYDFRGLVQHEAGGHGFAKLADEYIYHNAFIDACTCCCCPHLPEFYACKALGWYSNLSTNGDMRKVEWADLIFHPDYAGIVDMYEGGYYHTLLVVGRTGEDLLLAANTNDAFERPLSSYEYDYARFLHVLGVRIEVPNTADCFTSLLEGVAILPDSASRPPLPPPDKNPPQDGENAPPPAEMPEENSEEGHEETATPAENPDQTASMPVFLPAPPPYRPA